MDLTGAILLAFVVFGAIELFKKVFPEVNLYVLVVFVFIVSIGLTFLVQASVWANEQVIGGKPLDTLDTASTVLVGFIVGLIAIGINTAKNVVKNIGENQPE